MKTRHVTCYNCLSDRSALYDSENGYTLVKCSNCGLLYVNPRPDESEIDQAVQTGQHRGDRLINTTGSFNFRQVARYTQILEEFFGADAAPQHAAHWLDIGAGHGEFMRAVQQYFGDGVVARGVEPNVHKQQSAIAHGLDVDFFDLDSHDERYDRLSLLNVYSHLPDPVAALSGWSRLLKPGGELLLETGDSANLAPRDHHKPYYLPDHLSFASQNIVTGILQRIGFEILDVRKYRSPAYPTPGIGNFVKQTLRLMLPNRRASFAFFPRHPDTDMWIRAKRLG